MYVYIAKITDSAGKVYLKIGSTGEEPSQRCASLQTGSPFKLTLENMYLFKSGRHKLIEKAMHRELQKYNVSGEWFLLCKNCEEKLNALKEKLDDHEVFYSDDYLDWALEKIGGASW